VVRQQREESAFRKFHEMTLLREIQLAATDGSVDISTVLRKAKILAARLHNLEFEEWVNRELNGYTGVDVKDLPSYRLIPIVAQAHLRDAFNDWPAAPVMSSFLPQTLRWWAETNYCRHPIATVAVMVAQSEKGSSFQAPWPQEMAVKYGAKGYNSFECLGAWQVISAGALAGLVDTVRNRILDFVLKIENENPDAGEAPLHTEPVPSKKLQPIVHNTFYGSVGNIAQNSEHFNQTANIGLNQQELEKFVSEFTKHIDELELDTRQKQRAAAQIGTIKVELNGAPDATVIKQAGHTLRNITEGAIGSLLATAATQPTIWAWIHQMLSKF
jgi:hypothetical protein